MPTPAEILLESSTLSTGTPWDHLNNLGGGIVNVTGPYSVVYLGETTQLITYINHGVATVKFVENELINIKYTEAHVLDTHYVEQGEINMGITCS